MAKTKAAQVEKQSKSRKERDGPSPGAASSTDLVKTTGPKEKLRSTTKNETTGTKNVEKMKATTSKEDGTTKMMDAEKAKVKESKKDKTSETKDVEKTQQKVSFQSKFVGFHSKH